MGTTVSCILIVKDEERNIAGCLDTLAWADEVIVVDSGSRDRTAAICASYPRVVFHEHPWEGFGPQKNRALELATGDWVFSIDADERVTPELAREIGLVIRNPRYDAYRVKRKNFYRGVWVRHSGWWPDTVLRLFKRGAARFDDRIVHESVRYGGKAGVLDSPLEHHSYSAAGDFIGRVDRYSTLGAQMLHERGKRAGILNIAARSVHVFLKSYILKRGFLDGRAGLLVAFSTAEVTFYKYMKLAEMNEHRKNRKTGGA
ncbi:MAG: glycosyltransferase family 2 protein [Thermodesulfobacteriota bacterium]